MKEQGQTTKMVSSPMRFAYSCETVATNTVEKPHDSLSGNLIGQTLHE